MPQTPAAQNLTPAEGTVRKRVEEIEKSRGATFKQPPSMYVSVAMPLEVRLVPGQHRGSDPTLFYKVPQSQPCDFIINFSPSCFGIDVASTTMKAEPRMVRLLEKSGIKLHTNCRLPSPPAICEQWWDQAEKLAKKKKKTRPKYGLGYVHSESSESEDEDNDDMQHFTCHMTSVYDASDNEKQEPTSHIDGGNNSYQTSHQSDSSYAALHSHDGVRNENYLLSQVHGAMAVSQGEVMDAAPAQLQLEDGGQCTVDELVEINLGTEDDPRPTFVSASLTPEERESYRVLDRVSRLLCMVL